MELAVIVLKQTITMALYMTIGYLLFRNKRISVEGGKSLANILLWLVIPAVIIHSFCVELTREKLMHLGISAALGAASLILAMAISWLIFKKRPVDEFSAAFSNAGFMGIPLVRACFGEEAVFFLVGFVAFLNVMQWAYGAAVLSHGKVKMGPKQVLLNPISIGLLIAILLFVTGLGTRLPQVLQGAIQGITNLNAPLAMILLGVYLGQADIRSMLSNVRLLGVSAVRLVLIPAITLAMLMLFPVDATIRLAVLTAACAPVGSNVAVYAQMYGEDSPYACQAVAMSTLFSILSMPAVLTIGGILFS